MMAAVECERLSAIRFVKQIVGVICKVIVQQLAIVSFTKIVIILL
jgi:hypothetical protein